LQPKRGTQLKILSHGIEISDNQASLALQKYNLKIINIFIFIIKNKFKSKIKGYGDLCHNLFMIL